MGRFAENIKIYRKKRKMTQDELAKKLGVSRSAVGMWESGTREPDYDTLEKIADALYVNIESLIGREEYIKNLPWEKDNEFRDELRSNQDLRMLLSASSKLDSDDIKYLIKLAERMNRE